MKPAALLSLLTFALAASAQTINPLTAAVTDRFKGIRLNFEESADLMPDDKYGFRLTDAQRTFGEWIGHTAASNYNYCSTIKGEKAPEAAQHAHHLKAKAELSKALKDSFAYCAAALEQMTDQKALAASGPSNPPPVGAMVNLVSSTNEHYGNIVGYLRFNKLVPPSTARAQKKGAPAPKH